MFQQHQDLILLISISLAFLLLIWIIILQISILRIKRRQAIFFQGKKARSLETLIMEDKKNITSCQKDIEKIYKITAKNNFLAGKSLHKTGLIRFNPFRDIGGDQSFSLALLDKNNDGIIISSLYSREGVRVYSKSIKDSQSEKYPLTEEEKQAIAIASIEKNNQKK